MSDQVRMIGGAELRVIQATLRVDADRDAAIRMTAQQEVDWAHLQYLAKLHGIFPLAFTHLKEVAADLVPPDVMQEMASFQRANGLRTLLMLADLIKIVRALEAEGIPVLVMKGPILATLAYGNAALRYFSDLDILVKEEYCEHASRVLIGLGFYPQNRDIQSTSIFTKKELAEIREWVFTSPQRQYVLELHWRVNTPEYPEALDTDALFASQRIVSVNGQLLKTFSVEDTVVHLCHHGTQHRWDIFRYLTDFSAALMLVNNKQWEDILTKCRKQGLNRSLSIGVKLAQDMFGIQLPHNPVNTICYDSMTLTIAAKVITSLRSSKMRKWNSLSVYAFRLYASDNTRLKLYKISRRLFFSIYQILSPSGIDREWVQLPINFYWLYWILRPIRLIKLFINSIFLSLNKHENKEN